jgi:hypothetical protein
MWVFLRPCLCSTVALLLAAGCNSQQEEPQGSTGSNGQQAASPTNAREVPARPRDNVSRLKSTAALEDLHGVANNASLSREQRAEAVFSLFANHLKLPERPQAMGRVLAGDKWLSDSGLQSASKVAGWLPVPYVCG